MKTKLMDYYKILNEAKYDESSRAQFKEDIANFGRFGEHIYNKRGMNEVSEAVKNLAERASAMALDEAGDWFDAITVKKNMQEVKKDAILFEKTAKEMGAMQQRLESLYEDMAHKLGRYYEVGELAGKDVLPADNDYTANGEEEEEEKDEATYENYQYMGDMKDDEEEEMEENFKMDSGKQSMPAPGNVGGAPMGSPGPTTMPPGGMSGTSGAPTPGQNMMGLGDLMSDEEINNVKENYWNLQSAQSSLMNEDEENEDEETTNESRANYFARMKEQLENL